jgi:hypothetical protein
VGLAAVKGVANHVHDRVDILMHRPVPETQGLEAFPAQNLITNGVVFRLFGLRVLITVQLDDHPSIETDEVEDVASKWRLPTDMEACGSQLSKPHPQPDFGEVMAFRRALARTTLMVKPHPTASRPPSP